MNATFLLSFIESESSEFRTSFENDVGLVKGLLDQLMTQDVSRVIVVLLPNNMIFEAEHIITEIYIQHVTLGGGQQW